MKFIPIFTKGIQLSILLFTLSYCTRQKEINEDNTSDLSPPVLNQYENVKKAQADSLLTITIFVSETTNRLNDIGKTLARINSTFNAERRNMALEIGEEIFRLNKKHLELKAKNRSLLVNKDAASLEFEASLINEIDMLEIAVSNFKKIEYSSGHKTKDSFWMTMQKAHRN